MVRYARATKEVDMKVKSIRIYKGDAIITLPQGVKKEHKLTREEQRRIDKCLNCTKPASECKGECGGDLE